MPWKIPTNYDEDLNCMKRVTVNHITEKALLACGLTYGNDPHPYTMKLNTTRFSSDISQMDRTGFIKSGTYNIVWPITWDTRDSIEDAVYESYI
jgi:hypothetical protein